MHYIVFDLEFNQDYSSLNSLGERISQCPFEIIQIGAIKLDINFNTVATFNRLVKPTIFQQINPFITDLTGITTDQLLLEEPFPEIFNDYINFIGGDDSVFCTWGMSDMKELFRNAEYHKLDKKHLPNMFINLQPYISTHLNLSDKKLINLQAAVEELNISMPYKFHDALNDAYYTAELFIKIYSPMMQPMRYDPNYVTPRPRQPRKIIDFKKLLQQFEKMYAREFTEEEKEMVKLAYKMGRTNQFLK